MNHRCCKLLFTVFLLAFTASIGANADSSTANKQEMLYVVHFQTGEAWDTTKAPYEQNQFKEHSANLSRLRKAGVILFGARYAEFGMIFIKADSLSAATQLIESDPGVKAKLFGFTVAELSVFYPLTPTPDTAVETDNEKP